MLAIVVTLLVTAGKWDLERFVINPDAFTRESWRLVLSALPHKLDFGRGDVFHLPFNLYWLWVFGTLLEEVYGHAKLLALIILLAAGSAAAEYAVFVGGIGLSGVTYGLFGMMWVLAPRDRRFAGGVDTRTTRLMVGWFFLCIGTTALGLWSVANVAHGVGALLGALVGVVIASRVTAQRLAAGAAVVGICATSWLGATTLRPRINLVNDVYGNYKLAFEAFEAGRFDEAIHHYRAAVAIDPNNTGAWFNLGIAYQSTRHDDDALAAYRRAYELDPTTLRYRAAYLETCRSVGLAAAQSDDHAKAIAPLEVVIELDPTDRLALQLLRQSYEALGMTNEAEATRGLMTEHATP